MFSPQLTEYKAMSKDYRFRKDDYDDQEQQGWVLGKRQHDQNIKMTKAEIARKKRESKLMSEVRTTQSTLASERSDKH